MSQLLTDRQIDGRFQGVEQRITELENKLAGAEGRIAVLVERENERTAAREGAQRPALQDVPGPVFPTPVHKARGNRPLPPLTTEASDG